MTMPRPPEPQEPQEPRPLSEHECRALSELEQHLADDDPSLHQRMRPRPAWMPAISSRAYNALIQVAVVLVVLVVLLPPPWAAALAVVVVMLVPTVITVLAQRREQPRERPDEG
ncbi:hypothetical protein GCM10023200_12680 [Actinomycetospora chlora]|uniref:DUF3040 domain-containing protein n=1 Tax=Actinomycetospora chlora TaxID=663608 RepID=A0ABP9AGQ4_9PSEU